jgi:hypothetical protein
MTFQAYLDNIQAKTGKQPQDFYAIAETKGLTGPGVKATQVVNWLKQAMAIWHAFKQNGWVR